MDANLDVSYIYACAVLGAFVCLALVHQVSLFGRSWASLARFLALRFLRAPFAISRHRLLNPVSRGLLLVVVVFSAAVVAANIVGARSAAAVAVRSGRLCVINLVPLFLTTQFSFAAEIFGTDIGFVRLSHRLVGAACFLECLIHTILCAKQISLHDQAGIFGVLSTTSVSLLTLLPVFRHAAFELFFASHVSIAALLAASVWLHLSPKQFRSRFIVLGGVGVFALCSTARLLRIVVRNFAVSSGTELLRYTKTRVDAHEGDLIKITVILARPWKVRAGQYVYLQIPFLNLNSWLQSHPFMIISWSSDDTSEEPTLSHATELVLLVAPRAGWTSILYPTFKRLSNSPDYGMAGIIDGPYGAMKDMGDFGTVLMLATGIGIFAHVPYIEGLLNGISSATVRTRRIRVDWQVDPASTAYAKERLDELLRRDSVTKALDISIYWPGAAAGVSGKFGERGKIVQGRLDGQRAIDDELKIRRGALIIAVSAEDDHRDQIRRCISSKQWDDFHLLKDVQLVELDFQPRELSRRATRIV